MNTNTCDWCNEQFWSDDPEQGMCLTCKEGPSEQQNTDRAVEQYVKYIASLRAKEKVG